MKILNKKHLLHSVVLIILLLLISGIYGCSNIKGNTRNSSVDEEDFPENEDEDTLEADIPEADIPGADAKEDEDSYVEAMSAEESIDLLLDEISNYVYLYLLDNADSIPNMGDAIKVNLDTYNITRAAGVSRNIYYKGTG